MNKIETFFSLTSSLEKKKTELQQIYKKYANYTGKIVIISDLHLPFIDQYTWTKFYDFVKHNKDIKLIIIAGDLINFDKFSRYLTLSEDVSSAYKEIELARKYLKSLLDLNRKIIYFVANHELRLQKFLFRNLGQDKANELIRLGLSFKKFFDYKNLEIIDNWFIKIGDCIIAHPEVQSLVRGRSLDWIIEYFETKISNFNCVIIGHTHKQNKIFRKGKLGIEIGSMCSTLDYSVDSRHCISYRTEGQYNGFGILTLNKGKTDFNKTNFIFIKLENKIL